MIRAWVVITMGAGVTIKV